MAILKILQHGQHLAQLHREPGKVLCGNRQPIGRPFEKWSAIADQPFHRGPLGISHRRLRLLGGDGANVLVEGRKPQPERLVALCEEVGDLGKGEHGSLLLGWMPDGRAYGEVK